MSTSVIDSSFYIKPYVALPNPTYHNYHKMSTASTIPNLVLPKTQKVALVATAGATVEIKDHPVKDPEDLAPGECLLKMLCTGVCHTDLHAALGDWPVKPMTPLIGGHEGVGEIVAIGKNTTNSPVQLGQRVGVKWIANSCYNCEQCRKGYEQSASRLTVLELLLIRYD